MQSYVTTTTTNENLIIKKKFVFSVFEKNIIKADYVFL